MVIQIESLRVKNIGCFQGNHRLESKKSGQGLEIVEGRGGTGKTTLASGISLCLLGHPQNIFRTNNSITNHLEPTYLDGEKRINSRVSLTIYDQEIDQRFRFDRTIQSSKTRWGPVHAVDSLQVQEEIENGWSEIRSALALNKVFPLPALSFSVLDSETSIGNEKWGGIGLYDLIDRLGNAAARQAAARDIKLPDFYSNKESLREELVLRINDVLTQINNRYNVEHGEDGLIGIYPVDESNVRTAALPAGQIQVISQTAALVAGEMMPTTPPLIGDTLYGRLDYKYRSKMVNVLQGMDRHALLFLTEAELEGLDVSSQFKLTFTEEKPNCQINTSH